MLDPKKSLFDEDGNPRPALTTTLDNVLRMQRPLALSIVKKLREAHPDETPEQIHKRLDRTYLRDITAIGGVTGASAFVPGVGTVTSMSLSALAVGGYLERTALYAQAVAELHGRRGRCTYTTPKPPAPWSWQSCSVTKAPSS